MNKIKSLFLKMKEWDEKQINKNYIDQKDFFNHYSMFPNFAKFMWFGLERNSDGFVHYEYKNVCYKDLSDLCDENPDEDDSVFIGFNYGKKVSKTIVFKES